MRRVVLHTTEAAEAQPMKCKSAGKVLAGTGTLCGGASCPVPLPPTSVEDGEVGVQDDLQLGPCTLRAQRPREISDLHSHHAGRDDG